ncbi:MAG: ketol-acid reductoisomerase, partial [Alphaproteobacteria bacterium]
AKRRIGAEHELEVIGERLRGMMPWIAENAIIDKSKN